MDDVFKLRKKIYQLGDWENATKTWSLLGNTGSVDRSVMILLCSYFRNFTELGVCDPQVTVMGTAPPLDSSSSTLLSRLHYVR